MGVFVLFTIMKYQASKNANKYPLNTDCNSINSLFTTKNNQTGKFDKSDFSTAQEKKFKHYAELDKPMV
jgi:hypothetical protein